MKEVKVKLISVDGVVKEFSPEHADNLLRKYKSWSKLEDPRDIVEPPKVRDAEAQEESKKKEEEENDFLD